MALPSTPLVRRCTWFPLSAGPTSKDARSRACPGSGGPPPATPRDPAILRSTRCRVACTEPDRSVRAPGSIRSDVPWPENEDGSRLGLLAGSRSIRRPAARSPVRGPVDRMSSSEGRRTTFPGRPHELRRPSARLRAADLRWRVCAGRSRFPPGLCAPGAAPANRRRRSHRSVPWRGSAFLPGSARRQATGRQKQVSTQSVRGLGGAAQIPRRSTATSHGPGTGGDVGRRNQIVEMP